MRLSKIALLAIRGHKGIKDLLAEALDTSKASVYRYIQENDAELTKEAALRVIERETGLTREQILETETAAA